MWPWDEDWGDDIPEIDWDGEIDATLPDRPAAAPDFGGVPSEVRCPKRKRRGSSGG